ncbi:MFS transporter [Nocardia sp. NPDC051570]|uniref:MFS transporter n=1 Tax=Nocardia sp. NPDC051570 TaxID=3364324 RepID=UPI0037A5D129
MEGTDHRPAEAGPSRQNRWAALYLLCGGALMIVLDATIVNVALPAIEHELNFTQASLAWVVNAYLIAFGGLLLLVGRLGDLIGRRRMFLAGLIVFTVASALCGLAQSQAMLIAARFLQGAGGAMTIAVVLGMIVAMFPEPREQAKAIGVYAFVASAGGAVGLLAGGVLTEVNWHLIFAINIPIGIVIGVGALRVLDNDRGLGLKEGTDVLGAVLITSALMLGVYTIVKPAAELGWTAGRTLLLGALALALLAAFVGWEAWTEHPLMPLRIFRSRNVSGANLIQVLVVAGMFGMFFLGTLYMEKVLAFTPMRVGLAFLPITVLMGTLSVRYSERLIMRFGARRTLVPGLTLILIGLLLFTQAPVDGSYWLHVFPVMVLFGTGAGLAFPALMNLAMSGVSSRDAGMASGLANTTMQVGGAIGLAVLATLSGSRTENDIAGGVSELAALTNGFHVAFAVGAGSVVGALVVAILVLRSRPAEDPDAELDGLQGEIKTVHIM